MYYPQNERRSHFSSQFKSVIFLLFAVITGALTAVIVYTAPHTTYGTDFYQSDTVEPIPPNFSTPLEVKPANHSRKEVIGFLPYWAIGNKAKVYPEYMDQIIYFGLTMDSQGNILSTDANNNALPEWNNLNSAYFEMVRSEAVDTNTKILLAVKNFNNEEINTLISNPNYTRNGIDTIKQLVHDYKLDGINIDFEYVTRSDFPTMQFYNSFLSVLVEELRAEKADIIISFDVNATAVYADGAYDMVKIGDLVDQIIIMGYDYHLPTSLTAGPVAPITSPGNSPSLSRTLDSLKGRVHSEKIILGLPLYGYEWQTEDMNYRSKTVPGTGAVATYKRVRELIENKASVSIRYDPDSQSPWLTYLQNGRVKQIYYEDEKSLATKIDFVQEKELAGIALWSLGYEGDYIEPWIVIKERLRE